MTTPTTVLQLPGWQNSGPSHWQTLWEQAHGDLRVEQADWMWPRRGDWMAQLDEAVRLQTLPIVLVAHSLGCHLVAAWAAHSSLVDRVMAALLVAPPDTERDDMPPQVFNWRPIVRQRLPFASLVVSSSDDPYCTGPRAAGMAVDWGSSWMDIGPRGHINGDSGMGDWPEGRALMQQLAALA